MEQPERTSIDGHDLLTCKEAALLLRLTRRTLYRKVRQASIPFMRAGKTLLFSRHALVEWLISQGMIPGTPVGTSDSKDLPSYVPTRRTKISNDPRDYRG